MSIEDETYEILKEAALEGWIECRDCGNRIEPDGKKCYCGWENPLIKLALI